MVRGLRKKRNEIQTARPRVDGSKSGLPLLSRLRLWVTRRERATHFRRDK